MHLIRAKAAETATLAAHRFAPAVRELTECGNVLAMLGDTSLRDLTDGVNAHGWEAVHQQRGMVVAVCERLLPLAERREQTLELADLARFLADTTEIIVSLAPHCGAYATEIRLVDLDLPRCPAMTPLKTIAWHLNEWTERRKPYPAYALTARAWTHEAVCNLEWLQQVAHHHKRNRTAKRKGVPGSRLIIAEDRGIL